MGMLLVYFAFANIFSLVLASLFLRGAPHSILFTDEKFRLASCSPERVPLAEDVLRGDLQALGQVNGFLRTLRLLESANWLCARENDNSISTTTTHHLTSRNWSLR